ncbi:HD-GYP domain-containing protein [Ectobacillus polymachus]|uniref:HD-GYP domain-containing protein n=1 Tax=Ectobacillus polymachus TaxID=1508806 RepID=UPI003A87F9B4
MTNLQRILHFVTIFIIMALSWYMLYSHNGTSSAYVHLFYFPIVLSARFWRIKGGLIVSIIASILCGAFTPFMVIEQIKQPTEAWMVRSIFFVSFGILSGYLFTILENKRNEIAAQSKILQDKNKKITKQRDEILQQNIKIKEMNDAIQNSSTEIIQALAQAIEIRDRYTSGHCFRVSEMSCQIGEQLGLSQEELLYLKWSGILHDIGKLGMPEAIMNKPGKLTPEEFDVIKQHSAMGLQILSGISQASDIADGVYYHHERMDGSGYPEGIAGEDIPLQARIIAVSDVWDALTSKRSYRDSLSKEEALAIMEKGRGNHFDPHILDIFMKIIRADKK